MTFTPGQTGHTAEHNSIRADLDGRLSDGELGANFVRVRTSDGHPLPPSTVVVITLDKTLAEVTATPTADIYDITFEEA